MPRPPVVTQTLSDLTPVQRSHLAFLLDRHTGYGVGSIGAVCRGERGDLPLLEVFQQFDLTPRQALYYARKVLRFGLDEETNQKYLEGLVTNPFRRAIPETAITEARFARFRAVKQGVIPAEQAALV